MYTLFSLPVIIILYCHNNNCCGGIIDFYYLIVLCVMICAVCSFINILLGFFSCEDQLLNLFVFIFLYTLVWTLSSKAKSCFAAVVFFYQLQPCRLEGELALSLEAFKYLLFCGANKFMNPQPRNVREKWFHTTDKIIFINSLFEVMMLSLHPLRPHNCFFDVRNWFSKSATQCDTSIKICKGAGGVKTRAKKPYLNFLPKLYSLVLDT